MKNCPILIKFGTLHQILNRATVTETVARFHSLPVFSREGRGREGNGKGRKGEGRGKGSGWKGRGMEGEGERRGREGEGKGKGGEAREGGLCSSNISLKKP